MWERPLVCLHCSEQAVWVRTTGEEDREEACCSNSGERWCDLNQGLEIISCWRGLQVLHPAGHENHLESYKKHTYKRKVFCTGNNIDPRSSEVGRIPVKWGQGQSDGEERTRVTLEERPGREKGLEEAEPGSGGRYARIKPGWRKVRRMGGGSRVIWLVPSDDRCSILNNPAVSEPPGSWPALCPAEIWKMSRRSQSRSMCAGWSKVFIGDLLIAVLNGKGQWFMTITKEFCIQK